MVMNADPQEKILIKDLTLRYSDGNESLRNINLSIKANAVNVLFGPANGGKSTLLRTLNRLNDLTDVKELQGEVWFNGRNLLEPDVDVIELRRKIGIVFSRPVVLPMTIFENISYGLILSGIRNRITLKERVQEALEQAVLWDEVYDRLDTPAADLSGGQKQRLCLARSLALKPDVIMLDEPTSALDPVSTTNIEDLLQRIKKEITIILAPHNTQQAARMADYAAFFLQGELIEWGDGNQIFAMPRNKKTQEYIEGRFG